MALNAQASTLLATLAAQGGKPVTESTVAEVRESNWARVEAMGPPVHVREVHDTYVTGPSAELHIRVYTPKLDGPRPCMVWFHGGGWTAGNVILADGPARALAVATGCVIVAVNYQKAPEHRFPTALDDCSAAFEWAVTHAARLGVDVGRIGVGGDSAGGNLAAALCLKARDEGGVLPAFQVLVYPALDSALDLPSAWENAEGYHLTTAAMRWFWDQYAPEPADRDNPLAAPLPAPLLVGLPPAIVITVEFDPLRDEGERYADRLEEAGVRVVRHAYPGTIHGFLWMAKALPDDCHRLMDDLSAGLHTIVGSA